jgi:hypothetical protein
MMQYSQNNFLYSVIKLGLKAKIGPGGPQPLQHGGKHLRGLARIDDGGWVRD